MATDPSMAQPDVPAAVPAETGGYVIEIHVSADDKISVEVETDEEESPENEDGGENPENSSQSVPNIRAALKVAMDIYSNAGQIQDMGAANKDMEAGYKG